MLDTIGSCVIAVIAVIWRTQGFYQGTASKRRELLLLHGLCRITLSWRINYAVGLQKRIEGLTPEEAEVRSQYYLFKVIYVDPETLSRNQLCGFCLGRFGDSCWRASRFWGIKWCRSSRISAGSIGWSPNCKNWTLAGFAVSQCLASKKKSKCSDHSWNTYLW